MPDTPDEPLPDYLAALLDRAHRAQKLVHECVVVAAENDDVTDYLDNVPEDGELLCMMFVAAVHALARYPSEIAKAVAAGVDINPDGPLADRPKLIDMNEFRTGGYLFELNRQWLHPHGMALEVDIDDDGVAHAITGIWDCRDDPEGVVYELPYAMLDEIRGHADGVADAGRVFAAERVRVLGYVVQPIGACVKNGDGFGLNIAIGPDDPLHFQLMATGNEADEFVLNTGGWTDGALPSVIATAEQWTRTGMAKGRLIAIGGQAYEQLAEIVAEALDAGGRIYDEPLPDEEL